MAFSYERGTPVECRVSQPELPYGEERIEVAPDEHSNNNDILVQYRHNALTEASGDLKTTLGTIWNAGDIAGEEKIEVASIYQKQIRNGAFLVHFQPLMI